MTKKKSVFRMLVITVLFGIGMNFHHPVTPTLYTAMGLPSRIFGTSMAVMCFFSFLTSVFWGEFSNHLGRVKVFTISCVCYGLAQLSLGFSSSELMVLISRGAAGAFSGGAIVATMAYVIDVSEPAKQASNLAVYTAMQSASLAVGYLLGGVLGTIHFQLAFNVQAVWMIVLGVGAMFFVEDSIVDPQTVRPRVLLKTVNPFNSFASARSLMSTVMILFLTVVFLTGFASNCHENAFNYFLKAELDFKPVYNGLIKAVIGLIGLIANFSINLWIIRRTEVKKSLIAVLALCALSAAGALIPGNLTLFIAMNLIFFTANAVYQPITQALSVEGRKNSEVGIITGLFNAIKSMGNVLGSLAAGIVYDLNMLFPFVLSAGAFALSAAAALAYWRSAKRPS